jgi:5'(3')-deoxyribonucleotidase
MNKKTIAETMTMTIAVIAMLAIVIIGLDKALDNYEIVQCYKLQNYAEEYKNFLYSPIINEGGFYITQGEKQMCDYHGIVVNAPVR